MQVLGWQKISIYQFKGGMTNSNIEQSGRFGLFISYFLVCLYYVCYVFACFFSYLFLLLMLVGERGEYLVSIVLFLFFLFFYFSFPGEKVILFACGQGEGFIICWSECDLHFYFRG